MQGDFKLDVVHCDITSNMSKKTEHVSYNQVILPRVSSTLSTCTKYGFINNRVLISSTKSVPSYLHNIFLSFNVLKFSFMKLSSVVTEIYHQWSGRDEVAAAEMLVMVVSYRFHQRYTGTHRLTPVEDE